MTRREFEELVFERYGVSADYPFEDDLVTGVFRHATGGKWFALAMNIGEGKLGREGNGRLDVVNLKCAPEVVESLVGEEVGVYRAYHMNKMHWLTVSLAECDPGTLQWLLGISYELTEVKAKRKRKESCLEEN